MPCGMFRCGKACVKYSGATIWAHDVLLLIFYNSETWNTAVLPLEEYSNDLGLFKIYTAVSVKLVEFGQDLLRCLTCSLREGI